MALLLAMIPTPAYAGTRGTEAACGSSAARPTAKNEPYDHPAALVVGSYSPKTFGNAPDTAWSRLQYRIDNAADSDVITLDEDIIAGSEDTRSLVFGDNETEKSLTLDLNGHKIDRNVGQASSSGTVIVVRAKFNLTIRDSSNGGVITGGKGTTTGGGIYVLYGGSLTLEGGSIEYNSATSGGGIFSEGSLTLTGGSVEHNTADKGGGVCLDRYGQFTLSGGSITGNEAVYYGGGVYTSSNNGPALMGGSITGNSAAEGGGGLYSTQHVSLNSGSAITLCNNYGSSEDIPSNALLVSGKSFNVSGAPAEGSSIHVSVQQTPTRENPVTIALSNVNCASAFAVDNQPELTEIAWRNKKVVLKLVDDVMTWSELQQALNDGGTWDPEKQEYIIRLGADVTAGSDDNALRFRFAGGHSVIVDLCGHSINRGLGAAVENGNVLTVEKGTLILRDSVGVGTITGGNNTGSGGGVIILSDGALTANNVSITQNQAQKDGGGIYIADGETADVTLNNTQITNCTAMEKGGGLCLGDSGDQQANIVGITLLVGGIISLCAGGMGGGIYLYKGKLKLDSGTQILNNKNLSGDMFNNIDMNEAGSASIVFPEAVAAPIAIGLPTVAAAAAVPVWVKTVLIAGAALIIAGGLAIYCDWETSKGDQGGQTCNHPSWNTVTKWEEEYYHYVDEYRTCSVCGFMVHDKLIPEESVDSTTQQTTYTVVLAGGEKETRVVKPYIVMATTGISELSGITETFRVPHRRGEGAAFVLPAAPWTIEGYAFEAWSLDGETITQVAFTPIPYEDEQIVTVLANWKVSVTYDANVLLPEKYVVIGTPPQNPNPSWVFPGSPHELLPNSWEQYFVGVDDEGREIKSFYVFDGWDVSVGVKFTDKLTIEYIWETETGAPGKMPGEQAGPVMFPIMIRARWLSPWKIMDEAVNKLGGYTLPADTYATQLDTTMTVKNMLGHDGAFLDLKGYKAHAWFLSTTTNPITVQGAFLVKDSSDEKNGSISGGKNVMSGAGVIVKDDAVFELDSGNIRDNVNLISYSAVEVIPDAGGVLVNKNGSFVMKGGSVKGNSTPGSGGGVYIDSEGCFLMTGGEISSNKARYDSVKRETVKGGTGQGGGVYVGGSFRVSGKVVIKNNTVDGKANNVYLPNGKTIAVIEKLDEQAEIHVSMETPGVFTSGLKANAGDEAWGSAANFVSDDPNYEVVINADGEAELKTKAPKFDKTELELGGMLKLRFYMEYYEGWDPTGDRMAFTVNGGETRTEDYNPDTGYFVCPVNAYQMADKIEAVYYHNNEEIVRKEYTVKENLDYLKDHTGGDTLALVKATMNYGHYIQPYLAAANNWTTGRDHAIMPADGPITPDGNPAQDYGFAFTTTEEYNQYVDHTEFYLTLDAGTELNVRVYLKNGGTVTGTANGAPVNPVSRSGNSWVLSLSGIPSNALDIQYPFSCWVDNQKVFDLRISALTYANILLGRSNSSDVIEKTALTALYEYAMAAKKYRPE